MMSVVILYHNKATAVVKDVPLSVSVGSVRLTWLRYQGIPNQHWKAYTAEGIPNSTDWKKVVEGTKQTATTE